MKNCDDWGDGMKKLKKMWKKKIWKEYRITFFIEIVFLGVALAATGLLIHFSSEGWKSRLKLEVKDIQSLIEKNANTNINKTGEKMSEAVYMGLDDILPYRDDITWNSKIGVDVKFLDESDTAQYELNIPEVGCIWTTYDKETNELNKEWISLRDWFEDLTLTGLQDFERFYQQEQGHIAVQKMEGYYSGDRFIIRTVDFTSTIHRYYTASITGRQVGVRSMVYRVSDLNSIEDGTLSEYVTLETGSMDLVVYMPDDYVQSVLINTPEKSQAFAAGEIDGYNLSSYEINMYADTIYLATHDGTFRNYMIPIWLIGQGIAAFLIVVAIYMQKKQRELARLRNTFINAMAHEMKTPAAVIKNSAECLEEGIHPEKQAHYIGMVQKEADHMNDLLMSMLAYTRLSDSFCELNKTDCSLQEMMERSCAHYKGQIEAKNLHVIWDSAENTTTRCDEKLIMMVFDNFISNAVRFCKENGVIRFTISPGTVSVYNEGAQIPEDQLKEIWTPMYKGDSSRNEMNGTSGMGLAISAVILKVHRASYGVHNVSGGVEFYFKLPFKK